MQISNHATANHDPILGPNPMIFWDTIAPDGDALPFVDAPLGSLYVRQEAGDVWLYVKRATVGEDGDWVAFGFVS